MGDTSEAGAVLAIWQDLAADAEPMVNEWYNREHHPERVDVPGFLSARRYVAQRGRPKYFIFYRTSGLEVLTSPAYLERLDHPTPWTRRAMPNFRNNARSACRMVSRLGRGEGGTVMTLRFAAAPGGEMELQSWLAGHALPTALSCEGMVSAELWRADPAASRTETEEQRLRGAPDALADWVVMVSANHREQLERARDDALSAPALEANGAHAPDVGLYRLLFALDR